MTGERFITLWLDDDGLRGMFVDFARSFCRNVDAQADLLCVAWAHVSVSVGDDATTAYMAAEGYKAMRWRYQEKYMKPRKDTAANDAGLQRVHRNLKKVVA